MRDRAREGRAACTRYERSAKTKEEEFCRKRERRKKRMREKERGKRKRARSREDRGRRDYVSFEKCDENGECRTCLSTRAPREGGDQRVARGREPKEEERGNGRVVGRLLGRV